MSVNEENEIQRLHELALDGIRARREAATEYARQSLEYSLAHGQAMKEYGQQTLRTLFVMNGGGILATLTLVGAFADKVDQLGPAQFVWPLGAFVVGLLLCAVSMFCAYLNFQAHSRPRSDVGALCNGIIRLDENYSFKTSKGLRRTMDWSHWVTLGSGILSLAAFLAACWAIGGVFLSVQ